MRRRALLGTIGAGVVGATGCLSAPGPDGPLGVPTSESPWGDDWRTDGVDRVVVDRGPAERTGIDASRATLTLPTATATFSLVNRSGEPAGANPYRWTLWQRREEEWRPVYPDAYHQPLTTLQPGDSLTWEIRIDNGGDKRGSIEADDAGEKTTFSGVSPAEYAVTQQLSVGETRVLCVSRFEVVA